MKAKPAIGVDVGATKIAAALVDPDGSIRLTRHTATEPERGAQEVIRDIARLSDALADQAGEEVAGLGIGTPGIVDPRAGTVHHAVNLGWIEVHLVRDVRAVIQHPLPVRVQKDVNAMVIGEHTFGAGRDCSDFLMITIGSGLGGGAFANGRLVSGAVGNATEIGHLSLDPEGPLCRCGLRGCAETVISGAGLITVVRQLLVLQIHPTRLVDRDDLTTQGILNAASEGDELAQVALERVGRTLGVVLAAGCAWLNPARIILSGGLGLAAFEPLRTAARSEMERRTVQANLEKLEIIPSQLTSSAVGAACLVWYASGAEGEL